MYVVFHENTSVDFSDFIRELMTHILSGLCERSGLGRHPATIEITRSSGVHDTTPVFFSFKNNDFSRF
jgi:hypothetical protein